MSADTDFGTILALRQVSAPSVILFRGHLLRHPGLQGEMVLANLPTLTAALEQGCVAVFEGLRIRVRMLPIGSGE